jgi:hypothetical protein
MMGPPPILKAADFERMKIIARACGVKITTKSEVWRILHLADVFRGILRLSESRTVIRRGLEVAENRQSKNGPAVKRGQPNQVKP